MSHREQEGLLSYVSLGGVASLGAAAWLLLLSRSANVEASQLRGVKVLEHLDDVKHIERLLPALVGLRGRIGSSNPKQCELSDGQAVIHEILEEDILVSKNSAGNNVRQPFETRRENTEREWFLSDGGQVGVKVEGGRSARGLDSVMEVKQEYKERQEGMVQSTINWTVSQLFTGHKHQGHRKTERFLPVGAIATVVGELVSNPLVSGGSHKGPLLKHLVRRPVAGPFYITSYTVQQLQEALASNARRYKLFAACFGALGTFLIARKLLRRLYITYQQAKARQRVRAAQAASISRTNSALGQEASDAEEGAADRLPELCVVCLEAKSNMVYVNCGHMCCCAACSVPLKRCPICRTRGDAIRVYRT